MTVLFEATMAIYTLGKVHGLKGSEGCRLLSWMSLDVRHCRDPSGRSAARMVEQKWRPCNSLSEAPTERCLERIFPTTVSFYVSFTIDNGIRLPLGLRSVLAF